jgi:hypothetical protein
MDAIARIYRMSVQQNLSSNDGVFKPHKSRATVRAHIVHQCPTPLWKRAIVQITDWLSVVPRAPGLVSKDSLEPPLRGLQSNLTRLRCYCFGKLHPYRSRIAGIWLKNYS